MTRSALLYRVAIGRRLSTLTHMKKLTVLYNDKCPVCSFEIDHYRDLCLKRSLLPEFEKISEKGDMLRTSGLSVDDAKKRLHVMLPTGELKVGIDAFLALWAELPGYRLLGKVLRIPGLYHLSQAAYNFVLAPSLYWWDRKRS